MSLIESSQLTWTPSTSSDRSLLAELPLELPLNTLTELPLNMDRAALPLNSLAALPLNMDRAALPLNSLAALPLNMDRAALPLNTLAALPLNMDRAALPLNTLAALPLNMDRAALPRFGSSSEHLLNEKLFTSAYTDVPSPIITPNDPSVLSRQALLLLDGTVFGAAKEALKDPLHTLESAAGCSALSYGFGLAMASKNPFASGAALGAAAILSGKFAFDLIDPNSEPNQRRNALITQALTDIATNRAPDSFQRNGLLMEEALGPTALDLTGALASGSLAHHALLKTPINFYPFRNFATTLEPGPLAPAEGTTPFHASLLDHMGDFVCFSRRHGKVIWSKIPPEDLQAGSASAPSENMKRNFGNLPRMSPYEREPRDIAASYFFFYDKSKRI